MAVLAPIILFLDVAMSDTDTAEMPYMGYASNVDASGLSVVDKDGREGRVSFEEGTILMLSFPLESWEVKRKFVGVVLLLSGVFLSLALTLIKQLREILKTVSAGDPFVDSNAKRVRWIGLVLIIATFVEAFADFAVFGYADVTFVTEGFDLDAHFSLDFIQLIAGLCVLVIAEVFRQGAKLREEQSLTV